MAVSADIKRLLSMAADHLRIDAEWQEKSAMDRGVFFYRTGNAAAMAKAQQEEDALHEEVAFLTKLRDELKEATDGND